MFNILMVSDKNEDFDIDFNYVIKDFNFFEIDLFFYIDNCSDIKVINKIMEINNFKIEVEKVVIRFEFGVKYDYMFVFGN